MSLYGRSRRHHSVCTIPHLLDESIRPGEYSSRVDAKLRFCCNRSHVILNEVKDQHEVGNVYVNKHCRILILHFVQDDMSKTRGPLYMCCV